MELPREILLHIFDLATDEDIIFQHLLSDATAPSAWFKNVFGDWTLRTPKEALNLLQRRSWETKMAILGTCKLWHSIGEEFLFKSLFFDNPLHLQVASKCMVASAKQSKKDKRASLGWWTRRIHLVHYGLAKSANFPNFGADLESSLISIARCSPNLEIFIADFPLENSFGPVVATLVTSAFRTLRTIHWTVPKTQTSKVILALDALHLLVSVSLEFTSTGVASDNDDTLLLGSSSSISIKFPHLEQILLKGFLHEFLDQAAEWTFPSLNSLSISSGNQIIEPDVLPFFRNHGIHLAFLSLDCLPNLDVPLILELCPSLSAVTLNADWRLPATSGYASSWESSVFVNQPHTRLQFIGLHGLGHAFGTGFAASISAVDPIRVALIQRNNEAMFSAIAKSKNTDQIPKLTCIRALSSSLLTSLEKNNGPAEGDAMERWENWYTILQKEGIRLEDCTGNLLGDLPEDAGSSVDEDDDESEEESDNVKQGSWTSTTRSKDIVSELRQLVEECRITLAERESDSEGFLAEAEKWATTEGPLMLPSSTEDPFP